MFFIRPTLGAVATLLLCAAPHLYAAEAKDTFAISDAQMRALGIELVTLSRQPDTVGSRFPAQVILPPSQESVVSAPVARLVTQVLVQENQQVRAGTPLFVLSSPQLGEQQLALIQAQNRVQLARSTASRERALFKDGIIAQRRVIEADSALLDAEAVLQQAKMSLTLTGVSTSAINRMATSLNISNALTVSAKSTATVTNLSAKLGQRVNAADPLLQLAKLGTLWLDVQVPSGEASRWSLGHKLHIAGGAEGTILSVNPMTGNGQTAHVRAKVTSGASSLRLGEFVQVELPVPSGAAWDIPIAAIARQGQQVVVFMRDKASFRAVPIQVLTSAGQRAKVSGALKSGDRIAASSVIALKAAWQGIGGAEEE
jgi:cobalt-zinc-cadmium efflux system membrane fusion protein